MVPHLIVWNIFHNCYLGKRKDSGKRFAVFNEKLLQS